MKKVVKFPINAPVEVALRFEAGKHVAGRYGEQVMYSLLDNRVMYVPPYVEQRIRELAIAAGELLLLCKQEKTDGNKKWIEWSVRRAPQQPILSSNGTVDADQVRSEVATNGNGSATEATMSLNEPGPGVITPTPASVMPRQSETNAVPGVNGSRPPAETTQTPTPSEGFAFHKAVKHDAKLRLAVAGPGGSGKTYTLLKLATELGGRVAVVDSEHGSASKYADEFDFDVLELDSYDPAIVPPLIAEVAAQGYATLIIDSWSHFWMGPNGELEQVDQITARCKSNNSWAAWRYVSPKHNRMIDAMLAAPIHVLVSMRVKTEWVIDRDEKTGKTTPRKVGLQPVMRDGVEYEFDVCGDMDQENTLVVTKSRCPKLTGAVINKPGQEVAAVLKEWLGSPAPKPPASAQVDGAGKPWATRGEMKSMFAAVREQVGESAYLSELERFGVRDASEFRRSANAQECYERLLALARKEAA